MSDGNGKRQGEADTLDSILYSEYDFKYLGRKNYLLFGTGITKRK